ncbi:hypothetical protein [Haloarcula salinisoli]|uniref:Uncharacterized protein n=1 Tax=Haloarcula salinisoli TaxID=2487746 RepID=A0A8J7YKY0_9EURY|nr:hypothetical protein [Halomicroarcula salinisoli]MBX0287331.1 hypothetical protein [Halomicroarcula salinisoli]MBX0305094.1 hypothetical protein [Halomicroarcula salinisoli]
MDRFASCYFCGESFDASLSEYPVVPTALQPAEDGPTVVLCGTCRRKLGAVVEEVVDAAEGETVIDGTTTDRGAEPEPADIGAGSGVESGDAGGGSLFEAGADDGGDPKSQAPTTTAEEWESPAESDGEPDTETDSGQTGVGETDSEPTPTESDETGDDPATPDNDTSGAEPRLTKLEYNKVMRLLQNRPFPVDKAEIREVATSAYDIDPEEFDAVIEAAVSRDLIAVENGQFVDPE